jgi:hypothetical protein
MNDSLRLSIDKFKLLESRIDSLEKIVVRNEVSETFFSDILTSQLTIFVVIIGLIGLISFGWVTQYLRLKVGAVRKEFTAERERIKIDFDRLTSKAAKTDVNVHVSMFFICHILNQNEVAILWCLRLCNQFTENQVLYNEKINDWINQIENQIPLVERSKFDERDVSEWRIILQDLKQKSSSEHKSKFAAIENKLLKIYLG